MDKFYSFSEFEKNFVLLAHIQNKDDYYINYWLVKAKTLYDKGLPIILTPLALSQVSGVDLNYLYNVSNKSSSQFYVKFLIPKRNGEERGISSPFPTLKIFQSWVNINILNSIPVSDYAKAYRSGFSLKENTKYHRMQNIVVKLDIQDFFPSLDAKFIYKMFSNQGYPENVAVILTNCLTLNGGLPQGAPSSPTMSNILMKTFDENIANYCRSHSIRFTRYADDLTFSGHSVAVDELIRVVNKQLSLLNLKLNQKKIRILRKNTHQIVTGILVNNAKVVVPRVNRRNLRLVIYHFLSDHQDQHLKRQLGHYATLQEKVHYCNQLLGQVNFILQIDPKNDEFLIYKKSLLDLLKKFSK